MIQISTYGHLTRDPKQYTAKDGKPMTKAILAVDAGREPGQETLLITVVGLGTVAETLAQHSQGETIAVMGKLTRNCHTGEDGWEHESWSLLAYALHSPRTSRPSGGGKQRETGQNNNSHAHHAPARKAFLMMA